MRLARILRRAFLPVIVSAACVQRAPTVAGQGAPTGVDTVGIASLARELSADSMRGRGPWSRDAERAARRLAAILEQLGARPVFGDRLLVPFVVPERPRDTVFNVVGVLPARDRSVNGELIGIGSHLDHLGIGPPDARGDSIYNGFLDAAVPMAMTLDVARRYTRQPGDRPLVVMFFNLEEQGLLGSKALLARADAQPFIDRLRLFVGVDAGSPAGEAIVWQLMGGSPTHAGTRLADSLARAHGWTTTATPPRPINDVFTFSQRGVPILFPIPGATWKGYTTEQRTAAMSRFDHYHQPSDEWRSDFPWVGTQAFAEWLREIVKAATDRGTALR